MSCEICSMIRKIKKHLVNLKILNLHCKHIQKMANIVHIDALINDENAEEDLRKIIPQLRPDWKDEDLKFKVSPREIKAGLLNLMIVGYTTPDFKNAIMFRIRRNEKFVMIDYLNRDNEVKNIIWMNELYDFVPNILATFKNGFCYDYIDGEVMTPETIRLDCNWTVIAKQLALMHSTKPEKELKNEKFSEFWTELPDTYPEKLNDPEENERFQKNLPSKDVLVKELNLLRDRVNKINCETVVCHNDARPENMVWNRETGKITFVDWEVAALNQQGYEIAYHFRNYAGFEKNDFSLYPDKNHQMKWLRVYLETFYSMKDPTHVVNDKDLEKLFVQVNCHYLLFLINTVFWIGLMEEFRHLPFDVIDVSIRSYKEYMRIKDEILALEIPD